MHSLYSFIRELSSFPPVSPKRAELTPIPCLPPAPSRPLVVLRLPTSSANERLLAPACGEAPRGADQGVLAGPLKGPACTPGSAVPELPAYWQAYWRSSSS